MGIEVRAHATWSRYGFVTSLLAKAGTDARQRS